MDYYKLKILNHKKIIILIVLSLLIVALGLIYYFNYYKVEEEEIVLLEDVEDKDIEINAKEEIIVDIKGYINQPGVYSFKIDENARVNDLIIKAGGLKKGADTSILNLSKKLEDEMTVIVYSVEEVNNITKKESELEKKLSLCEEKIKNNACINSNANTKLININTASKEVLMTLSGIGESKALAIIKYRENTPFKTIDEIKKVEGIGDSIFEVIKENITI